MDLPDPTAPASLAGTAPPVWADTDACYRAFQARDPRFDGKVFAGVLSTGIYCRPICPARTPKRVNITFHPSAAAAQAAGFRPCLRCRPEASPDMGAWRGTSATVSRALALIEAGGLDEDDVEGLAGRLGVGGRQLRRLFRQHLGASPVAVAQTRRVLLAKQLIQETSLPMTDVALAAGFASVRRFNETFQTLFDRPPGALRRSGAPRTSGEAGPVRLYLAVKPPYDWDGLMAFLAPRALDGIESVGPGHYARTIAVGGAAGLVHLVPASRDRIEVRLQLPSLTALPAIIARVRRMFDMAADPAAIGQHLGADPLLAPLVAARPGLRVPGGWDGFEVLVRAILGQQVTVGQAVGLVKRIARDHGQACDLPAALALGLDRLFPGASDLAAADLTGLPMPRSRIATLSAAARAVAEDPSILAAGRPADESLARLTALPGIGPWTAAYVALRAHGEPDLFLPSDAGVLQAFARLTGIRPSPRDADRLARSWSPWRSYGLMHLWASLADPAIPDTQAGVRAHEAA